MAAPLLWACLVSGCGSRPAPAELHELRGTGLGTTWSVKWVGEDAPGVQDVVVQAISDVDAKMSTWRDDSELSLAREEKVRIISEDTAFVVDAALDLAAATGGAFDPTVEPLVELWGFHGTPRETEPTDEEIAAVLAQVGHEKVSLTRTEEGRARLDTGGTALDLSAIAKGYAVDRVGHALSAQGLGSWMVEIGGEVRVAGSRPDGSTWRLGIDLPSAASTPGSSLAGVVPLTNGALATSGNYRNVVEIEGRRVAHTLEPRTGRPVETDVASVTVVAPDCMTADGWATALMVLPQEAGRARIDARPNLEALWLVPEGDGFAAVKTAGFPLE